MYLPDVKWVRGDVWYEKPILVYAVAPGMDSQPGPSCVDLACSLSVWVGSLQTLKRPPTVQRHIGVGVNVLVYGCLSLYICPVMSC